MTVCASVEPFIIRSKIYCPRTPPPAEDTPKTISLTIEVCLFLPTCLAKVVTILASGGFGGYDLSMLPYMVVAGVLGGLIGSFVGKKISSKFTAVAFNLMQVAVMIICVVNIVTNSVAIAN